ncbi:MAG: class I SAM-dependent methyltransferase [Acidobacteriota bacterium]
MTGPRQRALDLSERLAGLPPEKRALFEQLMKGVDGGAALRPVPAAAPVTAAPARVDIHRADVVVRDDRKGTMKAFYDRVNRNLDTTAFSAHAVFLNFGYVANERRQAAAVPLPRFCLNKNCQKLILEVIADVDLTGLDVLDVGCGRGGTAAALRTYYAPRRVVGVDLCAAAVAFCGRTHVWPRTHFVNGDAESLPVADGSVDVVTNIESSHSYPRMASFYAEVARVLRPGGHFLYTDLLPVESLAPCLQQLAAYGMRLVDRRDITSNVLLSCDETASTHLAAFEGDHDADVMGDFLALPGSKTYDDMTSGRSTYEIFKLQKARGGL